MPLQIQKWISKPIQKKVSNFIKELGKKPYNLLKKENKLIFLDIYATWCGHCKKLKTKTFSNEKVGNFYNQNFINVALDGEKGEGADLMKKYNLNSFPSLLFIDNTGKVIAESRGYQNAEELIKFGKKYTK